MKINCHQQTLKSMAKLTGIKKPRTLAGSFAVTYMYKYLLFFFFISSSIFQSNAQRKQTTIKESWDLYKNYLKEKLPYYHSRLNGPSSLREIEKLESKLGIKLPEEMKDLYLENNGEDESWYIGGIMCGSRMLTIAGILKEWRDLKSVEKENNFNAKWIGEIYPENSIMPHDFNEKWIPIFSDDNGNFIGIDLAPGPEGKSGQIINFGTDEFDHFVIAASLTDFFNLINQQFENGTADRAIFSYKGNEVMFGFKLESHLTDNLRTIVVENTDNKY